MTQLRVYDSAPEAGAQIPVFSWKLPAQLGWHRAELHFPNWQVKKKKTLLVRKFNTAEKEKLDLYKQFPAAHITKLVKSHFPNVTADLSVLSLIQLQPILAVRTWPWAGSCGGWSLEQGWSRLAGELCQLWPLLSPLLFSPSLADSWCMVPWQCPRARL